MHIEALQQAVADGCDIFGYTWWGPIDIVSAGTGEMENGMALSMWIRIIRATEPCSVGRKIPSSITKTVIASNGQDLELPAED